MRQKASEVGRTRLRWLGVALAAAALAGAAVAAGALGGTRTAAISPPPSSNCQLGNGIKHVIEITFDNTHFNRDNPNVLSDLEQMPALKDFITQTDAALEQLHAADRPYGGRQPHQLHRALWRSSRSGARPTATRRTSTAPSRRRSQVVVRLLDGYVQPGRRSRTCRTRRRCRPPARRRRRRRLPGFRSRAPAVTSATSRPRTWCSRTRIPTWRTSSGRTRPRWRSSTPIADSVQGPGDQRLRRRGRSLCPERLVLLDGHGEARQRDHRVPRQ